VPLGASDARAKGWVGVARRCCAEPDGITWLHGLGRGGPLSSDAELAVAPEPAHRRLVASPDAVARAR
jgi:hypothetical protein